MAGYKSSPPAFMPLTEGAKNEETWALLGLVFHYSCLYTSFLFSLPRAKTDESGQLLANLEHQQKPLSLSLNLNKKAEPTRHDDKLLSLLLFLPSSVLFSLSSLEMDPQFWYIIKGVLFFCRFANPAVDPWGSVRTRKNEVVVSLSLAGAADLVSRWGGSTCDSWGCMSNYRGPKKL